MGKMSILIDHFDMELHIFEKQVKTGVWLI